MTTPGRGPPVLPSAPALPLDPDAWAAGPAAALTAQGGTWADFGAVLLTPPAAWTPPPPPDPATTRVSPVHQPTHALGAPACDDPPPDDAAFAADFARFCEATGHPPPKAAFVVAGVPVLLARLHAALARRGGYDAVCEARAWRAVVDALEVREGERGRRVGGPSRTASREGRPPHHKTSPHHHHPLHSSSRTRPAPQPTPFVRPT